MVGKAKWKSSGQPLPGKTVIPKHCRIAGGIAEISATMKALKDSGVGPTTSPFNLLSDNAEDRWVMENDS